MLIKFLGSQIAMKSEESPDVANLVRRLSLEMKLGSKCELFRSLEPLDFLCSRIWQHSAWDDVG